MGKGKRGQKVFTSIEAWSAHYLPGLTKIEREARAPFEDAIHERVVDILVSKSKERAVHS
jgi:hypothetical protein